VLLRSLISDPLSIIGGKVTEVRLYPDSRCTGLQIRIDQTRLSANAAVWFFLTRSKGRLVHWSLTSHQLSFIKYTNPLQRIDDYSFSSIEEVIGAVSFDVEHGVTFHRLCLRTGPKNER